MRIKKYILFPLCICILSFITVSAHSGKTDADGGHIDHSTGDYHYHHGYPAHDHYDMDGDGDLDCPYDFDVKKDSNSGGLSTGITRPYAHSGNKDNVITKTEMITKEVLYIPQWIYWVIGILAGTALILLFAINNKRNQIRSLELKAQQEESHVKDCVQALHNALANKYGEDYLYRISGAPEGDYVDDNLLPHSPAFVKNPVFDRYTFFLGGSTYNSSVKYHHSSCRYCRNYLKINAYSLRNNRRYQPCSICSPSAKIPSTEWVDNYKSHHKFLRKYVEISNTRQTKFPRNNESSDA